MAEVWVVTRCPEHLGEDEFMAAFSTEELAQAYVDRKGYPVIYDIDRVEMDSE